MFLFLVLLPLLLLLLLLFAQGLAIRPWLLVQLRFRHCD
jgi:hypothetical protein